MDPSPIALPWGLELAPVGLPEFVALTQQFDPVGSRLVLTLSNRSNEAWEPRELRLRATLDVPAVDGFTWIQGRYMQMDALVHRFGAELPDGYDGRYARERDGTRTFVTREVLALELPARAVPAFVAGVLRTDRFFFDAAIELDPDETAVQAIEFSFDLRGAVVAPGGDLELPPVLMLEGRDLYALIERYADTVAREMRARVPERPLTGWCSWYQFYNRVSEADVLRNLEELRTGGFPLDFVQIDDGYQSATGDWLTPNERFPSGMEALAERIREAGFTPGLWLAPLLLHENSATLRDHPDLALRTPSGETWFVDTWLGRCAVLDCTKPEAEEWLRGVIRTVVHEWGYAYLKLDALAYGAANPGDVRYAEPGTTAPAHLRRALEIIRDAAGDETFILGCTCHFGPAIGLVDAMRVGPDVKEVWADGPDPSVRHAVRLSLMRNWMHGRWWVNDPDCLIARTTGTALSEPEVRFLATGIAMSGGMVVLGDDLAKLPPARRDLALSLVPPSGVAARPIDPSEAPVPSAWRADLGDARYLVGILNDGDSARWFLRDELVLPGEVAFDPFNGRVLGMGDVLLRPHEGLVLQVTGRGLTPRVVGDSGSLLYGRLYQRQVSGRVQVGNQGNRPRVVAIEARGQVFEVDLDPGKKRWFD